MLTGFFLPAWPADNVVNNDALMADGWFQGACPVRVAHFGASWDARYNNNGGNPSTSLADIYNPVNPISVAPQAVTWYTVRTICCASPPPCPAISNTTPP